MDAMNKWIFFISINILLFSLLRITLPIGIIMLILAAMNILIGLTFSVIGTQSQVQNQSEITWHGSLPFFSGFLCLAFYFF